MAGQGITVSIQAKIEGWQDQIKQIQNAMKNIKPGADISKGLAKDLQQVETLVNNLGKNMTQRLTSDSQITHFVDRMMDVERIFDRLGSSMQNISFGDLNPEYITSNFKDLLSTLDKANEALGVGMQTSFQSAIADSKELQKEFAKMKLDPKDMNMDQVKEALSGRGNELTKNLQEAQKEASKLKTKMEEATSARDALEARVKVINKTDAKSLYGEMLPANGTLLDEKAVDEKINYIRAKLISLGATKSDFKQTNILPNVRELMENAEWDKLPQEFSKILDRLKDNTNTDLSFAQEAARNAVTAWRKQNGNVAYAERLFNENSAAQEIINNQIAQAVEQATAPLRQEIAQLKAQIEGRATAPIKNIGIETSNASAKGFQEAAASADQYYAALERVKAGEQMVGKIQGVIQRWFSVYAVVRMVTNAVKKAAKNIQELDATMTEIAIVTKMDQGDLWAQMPKYTKMAREYASSIKGVYEVSQIYYQQGLEMNDVMALTESTLKMARISGLGYSEAADYMTNAVRSFKMEMSDAERVVDVYSAVAASSASNVTELATAMSKTASSARAVGSSFENTTAMLAVMIEATRESPENIGSAMKSIISRYGELKENKTGIDEEGEEYSLNKVDKALQSVGISIHDAKGEFRDFDDVIFELAEHWNEIDKNTQRYIATVMAGNRQQSRFLALVSSSERLKEESAKATNSEDAAQLQFLKSLDSIDAKKQQLETSIQSIYTNSGIEKVYKDILDFTNKVLISFDNLSSESGLGAAIAKIGTTFMTLSTLVTNIFRMIKSRFVVAQAEMTANAQLAAAQQLSGYESSAAMQMALEEEKVAHHAQAEAQMTELTKAEVAKRTAEEQKRRAQSINLRAGGGMVLSAAGLAATTYASSLDINKEREKKATFTGLGSILSGVGTGLMIGGIPGLIMGAITAVPGIIEMIGTFSESVQEKVNRLQKDVEEANNKTIKSKDELRTLSDYRKKYDELSKSQHESTEKQKEFKDLQNEIAEKYPSLISSLDNEGNAIVDMGKAYDILLEKKSKAYGEDVFESIGKELTALKDIDCVLQEIYGMTPEKNKKGFFGNDLNTIERLPEYFQESLKDTRKNGALYTNPDSSKITHYGDNGFNAMLFDNKKGNLSDFFGLDINQGYIGNGNWGEKQSIYDNPVVLETLGKIYDLYKTGVLKETAYTSILPDNETDRLALITKFFDESIQDVSEYDEKAANAVNGNINRNAILNILKNAQTSEERYTEFEKTFAAMQYSKDIQDRTINTKVGSYINTIDEAISSSLTFDTTSLQKYAVSHNLSEELKTFYQNYGTLIGNEEYGYKDENDEWQVYDDTHFIEAFFKGGLTKQHSNEIDIKSRENGQSVNTEWYKKQLEQYDYLNESLDDLYKNLGVSSRVQIRKNLSKYISKEDNEQRFEKVALLLEAAFDDQYKTTVERYEDWASKSIKDTVKDEEARKTIANFSNIFGPEYLQGIQDQYKSIIKNTGLNSSQKEQQILNLTDILTKISNLDSPGIKQAAIQRLQTADLTSINGIYTFMEELSNIDLDLEGEGSLLKASLIALGQSLKVNVTTEIESYFKEIESAAEGFDKALSSASGGMGLKEAKEMADKLNVELNDFVVRDGKFYYNDIDQIKKTYIKDEKVRQQALRDNIEERYKTINNVEKVYEGGQDIFGEDILTGEYSLEALKEEGFKKNFEFETDVDYDEFLDYYEQFKKYQEEGGTENFINYVLSLVDKDIEGSSKKLSQWLTQTQAISELKNGKFNDFLTTALSGQETYKAEDVSSKILNAAMSGDFSVLQAEDDKLYKIIEPYIDSLISFFKDSKTSILNEMIGMVGTGADTTIKVTDANREYLKELQQKGLIGEGNLDDTNLKTIQANLTNESILWSEIATTFTSEKDRLEAFKTLHKNKYSKNRLAGLQSITDESITYDDFVDYLSNNRAFSADQIFNKGVLQREAEIYGLSMSATGDYIITNWSNYVTQLTSDLNYLLKTGLNANGQQAAVQDINAARAAVAKAQKGQTTAIQNAASDLLKNYEDISIEQQEAFANAMGVDSNSLEQELLYEFGAGGKTQLNLAQFKEYSKKFTPDVQAALTELFVQISDDYLKNITDATSYVTKGTTSQADIQKFVEDAQNKDMAISESAFSYDSILNAWTLDPAILTEYVQKQAQELVEAGLLAQKDVQQYLDTNVRQVLAQQIDIGAFLSAENKSSSSQAYKTLKTSLSNYIASSDELLHNLQEQYVQIQMSNAEAGNRKVSIPTADKIASFWIGQLRDGGLQAVKIMESVAKAQGKELSASDVEAAYRVQVGQLEDALDQLTYGVGSIVSGDAVKILSKAEYHLKTIGGNSAVITQIGDIAEAYQAYYDMLKNSGEATLAAINEAKARILEVQEDRNKEQTAIDALGDAAGMTYTTFAAIFTDMGLELTDSMIKDLTDQHIIEAMGGNKMRIKDFGTLARAMNWDFSSEEYISAFKTFNDGLIEINNKAAKSITEEVTALKDARGGEQVNLTELYMALQKADKTKGTDELGKLQKSLIDYGASLRDGILTLSDNANLYEIAQQLKDAASKAGVEIESSLAELSDAIAEVLQSYADAIKKGIEGGLNNTDKLDLTQKAASWGMKNLDFTKTAEGFKLTETSAINLYNRLKQIDALSASLTFDALKTSLEETNENFASVSALTSYIVKTRQDILSADSQVSDARLSQYQAELSVAQEILAVRSTQEDNSFNFMSNDIPAAQKNPLNYAKNWTQALQKIRDAYKVKKGDKTGFIDYEDYYNIVTEMNNIAGISGKAITIGKDIEGNALVLDGSLEAASAAIQAGCDSLTSIDTGDLKVNLGAIGLNISSGAEAMQSGVTEGIQAAAESQVKMLDGLIAMLEIIVAMEQLGDITGEDTTIDLGDIFAVDGGAEADENYENITGFTDKFDKARKKVINYLKSNKEAQDLFEHTKLSLGGQQRSMFDMLDMDFEKLFPTTLKGPQRKAAMDSFQGMLNNMYQAAISGDYDLNDIAASAKKIMEQTGVDLSDFVFEFTDDKGKVTRTLAFVGETVVDIDFTDESTRKAFDDYFGTKYEKDEEGYRNYIQKKLKDYQVGKEQGTLTYEDQITIRSQLAIASNEFTLQKNSTGKYVGYYNGQKFQGKDKDKILRLMTRAALFKDHGFEPVVEESKNTGDTQKVRAKTTIGGTEVEVDFHSKTGDIMYVYNGKKYSQKKIAGVLASEGKYDTEGTYHWTDEEVKQYTSTVTYDKELGLSYSYVVTSNNEKYLMYDGHKFDNKDQLEKFSTFRNEVDPERNGVWDEKGEKYTTFLTVNGGELTMSASYEVKTGETTFILTNKKGGKKIINKADSTAIADYMAAARKDNFEDETSDKGGVSSERTIKYNYGKFEVQGTINLKTGETNYEYTNTSGNKFSSKSMEALEYVMNRFNAEQVEQAFEGKSVTYTVNGKDVELIVDKTGKIKIKNPEALDEKTRAAVEEQLEKVNAQPSTLENDVEAKVSNIKIITEGANVEADTTSIALTKPIEEVTGKAKTLKITPEKVETNGTSTEGETSADNKTGSSSEYVKELAGVITSYTDAGATTDALTVAKMIAGIITSYTDNDAGTDALTKAKAIAGVITAYTDKGAKTDQLTKIKAIEALVTAYSDGPGKINVSGLATTFTALASAYKDAPGEVGTDLLATTFTALASAYSDAEGNIDVGGLATTFTALVSAYEDAAGTVDVAGLVTAFTATVSAYKDADGGANTSQLVTAFTAFVSAYQEKKGGANKDEIQNALNDLKASVKTVETKEAEDYLEQWRAAQEAKKLTITVEANDGDQEAAARRTATRSTLYNNRKQRELSYDAGEVYQNFPSFYRNLGLEYRDDGFYATDNSATQDYVNSLSQMVQQGKALSKVDFSNIETLRNMPIKGDLEKQIEAVYQAATVNAVDAESNLQSVKELLEGGIDVSNLESVASALQSISDAVSSLASAPWNAIVNGINSLSVPTGFNKSPTGNIGEQAPTDKYNKETKELTKSIDELNETQDRIIEQSSRNESEAKQQAITEKKEPITNQAPSTIGEGQSSEATTGGFISQINQQLEQGLNTSSIQEFAAATNEIDASGAQRVKEAVESFSDESAKRVAGALNNIRFKGGTATGIVNINVRVTKRAAGGGDAAGNMGAFAKGNTALAGGTRTLMGELGPELVVSNGRYFLVGQNGAEFVDLDKDAIVFNHKQTERLFAQGNITSRGLPFTNETNAISFAKGNISGPALARAKKEKKPKGKKEDGGEEEAKWGEDWSYTYRISATAGDVQGHLWHVPIATLTAPASAKGNVKNTGPAKASAASALAALKQLRAEWQALAKLSAKDLAGKAGGGGGGGKDANFIKQLERWYNLLQKIAETEEKINYQEQLRSTIQSGLNKNGKAYYKSQMESFKQLQRSVRLNESLALQQQDYFNQRRKELNNQSAFNALYTFDANGQIQYKSGKFEELSNRFGANPTTGKPNYSVKEQYDWLISQGYGYAMKYDDEGNEIDTKEEEGQKKAIEAFWSKIDADQKEMQDLHDSIDEHKEAVLQAEAKQNELLQAIRDNQIEVENAVLEAVVAETQNQIDEMQKQRDAIEEANNNLLDGLSEALDKERQMYETQQSEDELDQKRRRLAVLQRSGGSAAEISSLKAEIDQSAKDLYFEKQQEQIDAIKDASETQLERLDKQIELQQEALDYAKEHGLLWTKVSQIMEKSPEKIWDYIKTNNKEYWSLSPANIAKQSEEFLFQAEQWQQFRDSVGEIKDYITGKTSKEWKAFDAMMQEDKTTKNTWNSLKASQKTQLQEIYMKEFNKSGDANKAAEAVKNSKLYKEFSQENKKKKNNNNNGGSGSGGGNGNNGGNNNNNNNDSKVYYGHWVVKGRSGKEYSGYAVSRISQEDANTKARVDAQTQRARAKDVPAGMATGGMVTKPTLTWLGETGKPEAVLNPEQTRILRENLLSNKPNSLVSLLATYNANYKDGIINSNSSNGESVIIQNATLNMNVSEIANDYDAQRAGEQALERMLTIARKTKAQNRIRR